MTRAFAPANISLIFTVEDHPDPSQKGSKGLGFTINEGVHVTVERADKGELFWNDMPILLPTVSSLIDELTTIPVRVKLTSPLPLGCGFGLSGASALSTAYALNTLLNLHKTNLELAKLAHHGEVVNRTGLGDVTNQYFGGFCLKTVVSSAFKVTRIPFVGQKVHYRVFGTLSTKSVLINQPLKKKINVAGNESFKKIQSLTEKKLLQLSEVLDISYDFVQEADLLKHEDVKKNIEKVRKTGGSASMILLGNAVVADRYFKKSLSLLISDEPAHLILTLF